MDAIPFSDRQGFVNYSSCEVLGSAIFLGSQPALWPRQSLCRARHIAIAVAGQEGSERPLLGTGRRLRWSERKELFVQEPYWPNGARQIGQLSEMRQQFHRRV